MQRGAVLAQQRHPGQRRSALQRGSAQQRSAVWCRALPSGAVLCHAALLSLSYIQVPGILRSTTWSYKKDSTSDSAQQRSAAWLSSAAHRSAVWCPSVRCGGVPYYVLCFLSRPYQESYQVRRTKYTTWNAKCTPSSAWQSSPAVLPCFLYTSCQNRHVHVPGVMRSGCFPGWRMGLVAFESRLLRT